MSSTRIGSVFLLVLSLACGGRPDEPSVVVPDVPLIPTDVTIVGQGPDFSAARAPFGEERPPVILYSGGMHRDSWCSTDLTTPVFPVDQPLDGLTSFTRFNGDYLLAGGIGQIYLLKVDASNPCEFNESNPVLLLDDFVDGHPFVVYDPTSIGDTNGDGEPDLMVSDRFSTAYIFNGPFPSPRKNADANVVVQLTPDHISTYSFAINSGALFDVNGDGFSDVIVNVGTDISSPVLRSRMEILLGPTEGSYDQDDDGDIHFDMPFEFLDPVKDADFNGDGYRDMLLDQTIFNGPITHDMDSQDFNGFIYGKGLASYGAVGVAGHFNDDEADDIYIADPMARFDSVNFGTVSIFTGPFSGTRSYTEPDAIFAGGDPDGNAGFRVSRIGDQTGDGLDDLFVTFMWPLDEDHWKHYAHMLPGPTFLGFRF